MDPKQRINNAANELKTGRFTLFAGVAKMLQDEAFKDDEFLDHNSRLDLNVIKGDSVVLATTTTFADARVIIPKRDDGKRLVCSVGLLFDGGTADAKVPGEVLVQMHKSLEIKWSTRKAKDVKQSILRHSLGFNLGLMSDGGGFGAADADPDSVMLPLIASTPPDFINRLAPRGVHDAIQNAIDLIDSDRNLVGEITGLNGVTVAGSHSGVNATPYALVIDAY